MALGVFGVEGAGARTVLRIRAAGAPMTSEAHLPVLLDEVVAALAPRPGEAILDGTFGAGGYARAILAAGARVLAVDRDPSAVARGRDLARTEPRLMMIEGRFGALDRLAADAGHARLDGVVLDVGVSSMQLDEAERGFSFRRDGPLDMRMGGEGPSAADLVATLPEAALADLIFHYGEERQSRRIAAAIVRRRAERPITRTGELAALVAGVVGRSWKDRIDPATRTFQALRIAVNRELEELAEGLAAAERALRPGGRLVVVTFHSLEDRIAKLFLAERSRVAQGSRHAPAVEAVPPSFAPLQRKAVQPSEGEAERNPRARSAKLRAALRTDAPARPLDARALGVPIFEELVRGGRR